MFRPEFTEVAPEITVTPHIKATYHAYFDALARNDLQDCSYAAASLSETGTPFAAYIDDCISDLQNDRSSQEQIDGNTLEALAYGIQGYVFSGLIVEMGPVLGAARRFGQTADWVRRAIERGVNNLQEELGDVSYQKYEYCAYLAERAKNQVRVQAKLGRRYARRYGNGAQL